jgi:hypothetical protein
MTLILNYRPAPSGTVRTNLTRDERVAAVTPLLALYGEPTKIPRRERREVARLIGKHERTIDRAIADALGETPEPRAYVPSHEMLVRIAMHAGIVSKAVKELRTEDSSVPSYPTVMRALHELDAALPLVLRKGTPALERYLQVRELEPDHRLETIFSDVMKVRVTCQTSRGTVVDLWLLSVFEAYSRAVLAHVVTIGEPNAEAAIHVLQAATLGRVFRRDELAAFLPDHVLAALPPATPGLPEGHYLVGGRAESLITDNGGIYKDDEFKDVAHGLLVTGQKFARPYIGADKGGQERWHRTEHGNIAAVPGFTHGPVPHKADEGAKPRPYAVPAGDLPRVEAVVDMINESIDRYNREHVVSTTGQTPYERWFSDLTPVRVVLPLTLWDRMPIVAPNAKVERRGVFVDRERRTSRELDTIQDTVVEIRALPGEPTRFFVGRDGKFISEVWPHDELGEEETTAISANNARRGRTMRAVLREAGDRLATEGMPEQDVSPTVMTRTERRSGTRAELADPAAALSLGWNAGALADGAA